jgi:LysR family transcriptional regulator, benzoate and cis,cis-muconate-responsive activator of ben and cat genes
LGLSQPALSKSIARLEDAMEVKLFRRTAKGMDLTAEGSLCCREHANSGGLFRMWRAKYQM